MTRNRGWMLAAALFFTGAAVGALGTEAWRVVRGDQFARMQRMGPQAFILEHMTKDLGLSEEQRLKIGAVLKEMVEKLEEQRKPFMEQEERIRDDYMGRISQYLTPEQAKIHEKRREEMRQRRKNFEPGVHPPGPPPGGLGLFGGPPPPPPGQGPADGPPPPPPQ
ncbi:hypothetical protein [Fundidesulfovibrio agrisoli]|uniref:hypothetical protein n=1 Tax=Fundidesulfovibrio agrisoli TaxID=2922717 RepID=UPI001FAD43F2|nr:hypothetical protein [Fundidesulfovibrio agrisoli]